MQPNQQRSQIKPGIHVQIVLKQDQRSGKLTEGTVKDILTNSPTHPHGIKVRLQNGMVGRVQQILAAEDPPWIPIAQEPVNITYRNDIGGVGFNPLYVLTLNLYPMYRRPST